MRLFWEQVFVGLSPAWATKFMKYKPIEDFFEINGIVYVPWLEFPEDSK